MQAVNAENESSISTVARAVDLFRLQLDTKRRHIDRMFAWLFGIQWLAGVAGALFISPRAWEGLSSHVHIHVWAALFLGGAISSLPVIFALRCPGAVFTRHVIAVAQMLTSALFIDISGGRIETHFHVFGSLAFLAMYQDWAVLLSGTIVVALDHALRGIFWPQSVFGVLAASPWRWLEHAGWVLFEDAFLVLSIRQSLRSMFQVAERQAELERMNEIVEKRVVERTHQVEQRTSQLTEANLALKAENEHRQRMERERQQMEVKLRQAQKLEAIGQLAAGVAHEINTPAQYVGDNTHFLAESWQTLAPVLRSHQELLVAAKGSRLTDDFLDKAERLVDEGDLNYLYEQIPAAIEASLDGVERVTRVVRAIKEFAHPGSKERTMADLNHAIETTVMVATHEWKYVADIKLELEPGLVSVPCFLEGFNQSVLNLVVNAAHSIADVVQARPGEKGTITIKSRRDRGQVEISVSDTGTGIPEAVRPHLFEPFFTTKGVGRGSGQGLSIVHGSIVKEHGGEVAYETEMGKGTTFILRLPLESRPGGTDAERAMAFSPA